jgi:hypothetical protein
MHLTAKCHSQYQIKEWAEREVSGGGLVVDRQMQATSNLKVSAPRGHDNRIEFQAKAVVTLVSNS